MRRRTPTASSRSRRMRILFVLLWSDCADERAHFHGAWLVGGSCCCRRLLVCCVVVVVSCGCKFLWENRFAFLFSITALVITYGMMRLVRRNNSGFRLDWLPLQSTYVAYTSVLIGGIIHSRVGKLLRSHSTYDNADSTDSFPILFGANELSCAKQSSLPQIIIQTHIMMCFSDRIGSHIPTPAYSHPTSLFVTLMIRRLFRLLTIAHHSEWTPFSKNTVVCAADNST